MAYSLMPAGVANQVAEYRIGPMDVLNFSVFQEPDFTNTQMQVDSEGNIFVPLIGSVTATGRTSRELADLIAARLGSRYLINPQVSIGLVRAVSQRVTVEGEVRKPGVFPIVGQTSLLQAVALAEGPNEVAQLDEVLVFRNIGEERQVARFDLRAIRLGSAPDPEILGSDVVVIGYSNARRLYRDGLTIIPTLTGIFVALANGNR